MKSIAAEIADSAIPRATDARYQHLLDTYASEINKLLTVWHELGDADLEFRPHPRSATVAEILKHELLSERRFFAEFLNLPEPPAAEVLPTDTTVEAYRVRVRQLAEPRLTLLASKTDAWWHERMPFFDVERERAWIFWRRVLHTAHHRTQLTVYLRLLDKPVPSTYGPTADATWAGADPTNSTAAAARK